MGARVAIETSDERRRIVFGLNGFRRRDEGFQQGPCGIGLEHAYFTPPAWLSTLVFWQTLPVTLEHEDQADELPRPPAAPQAEPPKMPPREVGGRQGPEPTRYGDWEVRGRCIDF